MTSLKNSSLLLFLCITMFSCASILSPKKQKVTIETASSEAKVYINDELIGTGKKVVAEIDRDATAKQVRVETPNQKPFYTVLIPSKRSSLANFSLLFALFPYAYDKGRKAYDYPATFKVSEKVKTASRSEKQKYVSVEKIGFSTEENNLSLYVLDYETNDADKEGVKLDQNKRKIDLDNTIFTETMNEALKKIGFIDTTKTLFQSKYNTLGVEIIINKLKINHVYKPVFGRLIRYVNVEVTSNWKVKNSYAEVKKAMDFTAKSGDISYDHYNKTKALRVAVEDALATTFQNFIAKKEIQSILPIEEGAMKAEGEKITLLPTKKSPESIEEAIKSTVTVVTDEGHGSGLFISKDGYILTNYHVIANQKNFKIVTNGNKTLEAEVVRKSEVADLALLKVKDSTQYAFQLPSEKTYAVGQDVFCIGTPNSKELGQTVSKGIVSGKRKQGMLEMIQTDVSVNQGNSGGPLIDKKANLLGIVNSKLMGVGVEGIGFCIPAHEVLTYLNLTY